METKPIRQADTDLEDDPLIDQEVTTPDDVTILEETVRTPDDVAILTGTDHDETGKGENMATES